MKRKDFIKKAILTGVVSAIAPKVLKASNEIQSKSTYDKLMQQVGFNHLPNKKIHTMNSIIHKADTRGKANHGWLNSHHSFSFANYYNPDRMNFGVLRVLNDDVVKEGMVFLYLLLLMIQILLNERTGSLQWRMDTSFHKVISGI